MFRIDFASTYKQKVDGSTTSVVYMIWPTPVWNLGVTTGVFSVLMIKSFTWALPLTDRLWSLGTKLHIHAGD